jgi:adenine-specific DNA-methyltransferase
VTKKRARNASAPKSVDATRHRSAKRVNIPTAELEKFAEDEEREPATVSYPRPSALLFPRDPAGDPQLVWRGKDEQDASDLGVPALPIYIQEKISPQTLIEDLRSASNREQLELQLYADFNGLEFEQLVDFYRHEQSWSNRMILGDSLQVMTSLAEKEGLRGKVQCIYMDPPYGIRFGSNWQVSTRDRDVKDGNAEDTTRQPEQIKAFRDTWKVGIHSYLTYLRDRLMITRELLTDTGSLWLQMGDQNVHLVRAVVEEIFGPSNFAASVHFYKTSAESTAALPGVVDHLIVYAKDLERLKFRTLLRLKKPGEAGARQYTKLVSPDFKEVRNMTTAELSGESEPPAGWEVCALGPTTSPGFQASRSQPYVFGGEAIPCPPTRHWSWDPSPGGAMDRLSKLGRLRRSGDGLRTILLAKDNPTTELDNVWMDTGTGSFTEDQIFVVQTSNKVVERCILMATDPGDLVLDPTCGSGTTAFVAEQWGRRWITIDTSRVALALARTRLMSARYPYYILADSAEGQRREAELAGTVVPAEQRNAGDIRRGFVCKRVPHVTLKSIADNPDIKDGMTRTEVDAAIARRAETEILIDLPYVDPNTVRVSGPFTGESLSPHRVLDLDGAETGSERATDDEHGFVQIVLDNLKTAGVQNTVKNERLVFETLELYPGTCVQASGTYREGEAVRRAGISVGPEYGTVGADFVREASKEAATDFDLLIICGMAFDARVGETGTKLGRLTVLRARMNPDLSMGGDLLKKTASANLFTVFGEPDVDIRRADDRKIVVEVRGVDVYDPTTGEIRSHSTDDIACWFIDTDYNEESFFVRHAYFLGGDDPYEKLRRTLKADIDEAAWASLHSAVSRPFAMPLTGKIAVKVINHYGDEVLKVYEVGSGAARRS